MFLKYLKCAWICDQQVNYFDKLFTKYHFDFRKSFSAQECLMFLLSYWKEGLDSKNAFEAILMKLCKAFECVDHELLKAKIHTYDPDLNSLKLIHSYLNKRKQINNSLIKVLELKNRVLQRWTMWPRFSIFIFAIFFTSSTRRKLQITKMTQHHQAWPLLM